MNWLTNLREIKVEITSYCNAACPGCTRNVTGGKLVDNLDLNHMSLDLWERIMKHDTKSMQLETVIFDGNVGDFCMNPDALRFVELIKLYHPKTNIHISTNGGTRNQKFWLDLGKLLHNHPHRIDFAIDGLEDTHHIHRRNTTYDKVVTNMRSFIDAGGQASWVYTIFDYNTHQIEEARRRAIEYGCCIWHTRHSCIPGEDLYTKTKNEEYEITTDTIENFSTVFETLKDDMIFDNPRSEYTNHVCSAFNERQIQIDFRGILWPCAYIYATEVFNDGPTGRSPFYKTESQVDKLNLAKNTLREILTNDFFRYTLPEAIENKKWEVCKHWCIHE